MADYKWERRKTGIGGYDNPTLTVDVNLPWSCQRVMCFGNLYTSSWAALQAARATWSMVPFGWKILLWHVEGAGQQITDRHYGGMSLPTVTNQTGQSQNFSGAIGSNYVSPKDLEADYQLRFTPGQFGGSASLSLSLFPGAIPSFQAMPTNYEVQGEINLYVLLSKPVGA